MRYTLLLILIIPLSCRIHDDIESIRLKENLIFSNPYTMASFPGGSNEMYTFIDNNYRNSQPQLFSEGKIYVEFIIELDGSLSEIKVIRGLHEDLDKEAIRVFEIMPKWEPAIAPGIPVRSKQVAPVFINLNN